MINLNKKETDIELLSTLHNNRKDYSCYINSKKPPLKNQYSVAIAKTGMLFLKLFSGLSLICLVLFIPLFCTSVLFDTTINSQLSLIVAPLLFIYNLTAEEIAFGFIIFLGSFLMVGPFVLIFESCSCKDN